jgi:beta-galactosidase
MEVQDFDEASLPNLTVTEPNPAARLDYWRFQSEQVAAYDRMQCEIIRRHSPGRWITHNFMGFFNEFDHWALGEHLDFASWDSYPIGLVEHFPFDDSERLRWQDTSHPDVAPFHHDLYRGVGRGRFWVMEQQPGPVNWARWNPAPAHGMVRLWTLEAHAHGAEVVSYFRWRQAPFAQEQMHAGLNLPSSHELSPGGREALASADDLARLGDLPASAPAQVAIVYDYEAHWITAIQPQGADFRYPELVFRWYGAIRRLGLDVDFVPPGARLDNYRLVLAPCLPIVSVAAERAFAAATGIVAFGPRSGSKTHHFSIPDELPPGPLQRLLRSRVIEVSSLRPGVKVAVIGAISGYAERWREVVETRAETLATFADGAPALVASDNHFYLACWPNAEVLGLLMELLCQKAGLSTIKLPAEVRLRRRGDLTFAFNYGEAPWPAPFGDEPLIGASSVAPHGFSVWQS